MEDVEARLWSRWQRRHDDTAFEELVRPHLRFLRGFARRLGCSAADADDVVQKTLVRLADDRTPEPATVGLRAWLGRTLLSEVRMFFRARGRWQRYELQARVRPPQGTEAIDHRDEVEAALGAQIEGCRAPCL